MAGQERWFGYNILDMNGKRIGEVDNLWAEHETRRLEFLGVKTGWLAGKTHLIPAANATIDDRNRAIRVPYAEEKIRNAPTCDENRDLSPTEAQRVYDFYGVRGTEARAPTGAPRRETTAAMETERGRLGERGGEARQRREEAISMPLAEEQLRVGKREVPGEQIRLRKVIRTEHVEEPINLRREEIHIERVPARNQEVPRDAFSEREVSMTAMREEPVVEKQTRVAGEVRAFKTTETEQDRVEADIRREDVEVDRGTEGRRGGTRKNNR